MNCRVRIIKTLCISLFFATMSNSLLANPLSGQIVTTVMSIRTDHKAYSIPLPNGNWTVAATTDRSAEHYHGDSFAIGRADKVFVGVSLVQQHKSTVTGLILLQAQVKTFVKSQTPDLCVDAKEALHVNKFGASRIVSRCLEIKPLDAASRGEFEELIDKTRDWLIQMGLSLPTGFIGFQYAEFDSSNRYLDFSYYLNPSFYGLPSGSLSGGQAAWTRGAVSRDSQKMAFQTALTAYAQRYSTALHDAFEGRGAASALTLQPFVFKNLANSPSSPASGVSGGPSGRLLELKTMCESIGFKDGTTAMKDCIKELLVR